MLCILDFVIDSEFSQRIGINRVSFRSIPLLQQISAQWEKVERRKQNNAGNQGFDGSQDSAAETIQKGKMPLDEFVDKVSQNAERNERNEKSQCARENDNRCCGKFQVFRKKRLQDFRKVNDADGPAYPSG